MGNTDVNAEESDRWSGMASAPADEFSIKRIFIRMTDGDREPESTYRSLTKHLLIFKSY